jgi:hypothetical protein
VVSHTLWSIVVFPALALPIIRMRNFRHLSFSSCVRWLSMDGDRSGQVRFRDLATIRTCSALSLAALTWAQALFSPLNVVLNSLPGRRVHLAEHILQRLLHALRNKDVGDGDLTNVAWNYASKRHMLASACHDGSTGGLMTFTERGTKDQRNDDDKLQSS